MSFTPLKRTTIMTLLCCVVLGGIGLARVDLFLSPGTVFLVGILAIVFFKRSKKLALLFLLSFGLLLGWWRGSLFYGELQPYKDLERKDVVLQVVADGDAVYGKNSQLEFDVGHVKVLQPFEKSLPGKLVVSGFGENAIYRGDTLNVKGNFYPRRGGKQGGVSFAEIHVLERGKSIIDSTRRKFGAGMQTALPEPLASFGLGLLLGQRNTLPKETSDNLSSTGLTHLIAVSGYNLTIIIAASRSFLGKRSRYQSLITSLLLIALFVLMTGFSASIVRAALVSTLSLGAWFYGRTFRPIFLIAFTACVTAFYYPVYLWSDIGWYLSFLAFFGILVIAPIILARLQRRSEKSPHLLTLILVESFSAQIMALPLILYIFKEVSMVSLLANALVVPFVPLAMLLALIAGLAGMVLPQLAGWLALPARLILTYMLDVTSILARLPHALVERAIALWELLAIYASILAFTLSTARKNRDKIVKLKVAE